MLLRDACEMTKLSTPTTQQRFPKQMTKGRDFKKVNLQSLPSILSLRGAVKRPNPTPIPQVDVAFKMQNFFPRTS